MPRLALSVTAALCAGCGSVPGTSGMASPATAVRPGDRVLYGDFSRVQAIATATDRVYMVYPGAVAMIDGITRRIDVPRSAPSDRALARVSMAAVDRLDRSLWLVGGNEWFHYDPTMDRWRRGSIPMAVRRIAVDRLGSGGIWLEVANGWTWLTRSGRLEGANPPQTLEPVATLDDAYREEPWLQAAAGTIGIGPGMRVGRITAAARGGTGIGWYVGTELRGAFYTMSGAGNPEWLTIGLPSPEVGAVAVRNGIAWVATDRTAGGASAMLTAIAEDGGMSNVIEGDAAFGLGINAVRRLLVEEDTVWLAADDGVTAVSIGNETHRRFRTAGPQVAALIRWNGRLIAGTQYGVEAFTDEGFSRMPAGAAAPVLELFATHDTLWIGTDRGLAMMTADDSVLTVPGSWRAIGGAIAPVTGIGAVGDTLVVLTAERLHWRDPVSGAWQFDPPLSFGGPYRYLVIDQGGTIWIAGDGGTGSVRLGGGAGFPLTTGRDLPGPPTGIAVSEDYLWVGTRHGVLRVAIWGR